jgi:hypothetical protein
MGIDISPTACRVMAKRRRDVCGLPESKPLWKTGRPPNQRRRRGIFVERPPKQSQAPSERHLPLLSLLRSFGKNDFTNYIDFAPTALENTVFCRFWPKIHLLISI